MKRILLLLLCFACLTTAGCAPSGTLGEGERTIKIAVMDTELVFSADDSYINGISMAIEDLNVLYADQGYHISWQFYEDGDDFQQGMSVVNEILSDPEITAVIGTSSLNILDVAADMLDSAGKLLITYYGSSDSLLENGYTHVFRNCFGEADQGVALALYAAARPDMTRAAIYRSDTEYERHLAQSFLQGANTFGLEVVDASITVPTQAEVEAIIERWQALDVDTVMISQYYAEEAFSMMVKLRSIDPDINILGDFSFDYPDYLQLAGDYSDNICIVGLIPLDQSPEVEAFYQKYREKYDSEPTPWAVQLYDSVRMVADTAVRIGSTDPTDIAQTLRGAGGYTGVGGTLIFDETGELTNRYPNIMISQDAMFNIVDESEWLGQLDAELEG